MAMGSRSRSTSMWPHRLPVVRCPAPLGTSPRVWLVPALAVARDIVAVVVAIRAFVAHTNQKANVNFG